MKGLITTIQRMSIHDGPGIRSTVFMKGCNMRCSWCHNPETWSGQYQLQYFASKCIGCQSCVQACEAGAIQLVDNQITIDKDACTLCKACAEACPTEALVGVGETVTVEELVARLVQDRTYFDQSNGGVTISGGEPLLQHQFVYTLLKELQAQGIHTAIESNLSVPQAIIEKMLPVVDTWICDLKLSDDAQHRHWTGKGNAQVLSNISYLIQHDVSLTIHTPVVPGVNDSEEAILAIVNAVKAILQKHHKSADLINYDLLGFHTLGFDKFDTLNMTNELRQLPPMDTEKLNQLKQLAASNLA